MTTIDTATSDGASVSVTITLRPSTGICGLMPAASPAQGLGKKVGGASQGETGEPAPGLLHEKRRQQTGLPTRPRSRAPVDGGGDRALWRPRDVDIVMTPDPSSVKADVLAAIAARLEPPQRKVLVLGLDGLDWRQTLPLIRAGRMPNLERLMAAGVWGEMDTITPILSPLIWTTMATGVAPDVHGVLDFVERDPESGQQAPVSGRSRRVPAIWNIASALDIATGVVGWWATWPAEKVTGAMVSDRLYYTLQQGIPKETFHVDPPDLVFPGTRTAEFTELRDRAVTETDWNALRFFMDVPQEAFDQAVAANLGMEDPIDGMRRILSATRTYMGAGLTLAGEKPDLLMVYLEGTDTIGHLLAPYLPPPTIEVEPREADGLCGSCTAVLRNRRPLDRALPRGLPADRLHRDRRLRPRLQVAG